MNVLRRVVLAVYSLLLIGACVGLAVLAWNQDQQLDINPGDFRLVASISSGDTEQWIFTLLMGCLATFGVLTFLLAFISGGSPSRGTLRMRQADGGTVEVTAEAVENLLREELEALPEVRQAVARVRLAGAAVETDVAATIEPSVSIAHVTNLIAATVSMALREQVGATNVKRPNIRIEYDELAARPAGMRERPLRAPEIRTRPQRRVDEPAEPWPEPPPDLRGPNRVEETPPAPPPDRPEAQDVEPEEAPQRRE